MEKLMMHPRYAKKHITQFLFIALVTTVTLLKRIGGGKVIRHRY